MGRPIKCRFCKNEKKAEDAYKVVIYNSKGTPSNAYFCNEEHYKKMLVQEAKRKEEIAKRQALKDKAYYLICDIIGKKEIINTALWDEWKTWNKVASNEVLGQYLEENKDYLTSAISKLDNIEYNRIKYLSKIIKCDLVDYKPKKKEKEIIPVVQVEHYETKFKNKKKVGFEDLEEEFDD